jgi:hypothetical protein
LFISAIAGLKIENPSFFCPVPLESEPFEVDLFDHALSFDGISRFK